MHSLETVDHSVQDKEKIKILNNEVCAFFLTMYPCISTTLLLKIETKIILQTTHTYKHFKSRIFYFNIVSLYRGFAIL